MNNNENTPSLYKKLQELLPDYVFDRLNEEDKLFFEKYVNEFPDLVQEVRDAREVFAKIRATKFDEYFEKKSRNISVRTNKKSQLTYNQRYYRTLYKYVMPSLGLITILILLVFGEKFFFPQSKQAEIKKEPLIQFLPSEKDEIYTAFVDTTSKELTATLENIQPAKESDYNEETIAYYTNLLDDYYMDVLLNYFDINTINYISTDPVAYYNLLNLFNNIKEEDFQIILKEIENAKINS